MINNKIAGGIKVEDKKPENGGFLKGVKLFFYYLGLTLLTLLCFALGITLFIGTTYSFFAQFKTLCYDDLIVIFIMLALSATCIFIAYGVFGKIVFTTRKKSVTL